MLAASVLALTLVSGQAAPRPADPALAERYGLTVPVVAVDGKVRFKGVVNPVLLERLLAAQRENR